MTGRNAVERWNVSHAIILALAIGATVGWGMWFLSGQRADRIERELREQISTLAQSQVQLLHEREVAEAAKSDLASLRSQSAALRQEIEEMSQNRDRLKANAPKEAAADAAPPADGQTPTADAASTDHREALAVSNAQKILTKLGYGPLAADGVMGPSTRQALEEFQYKNGIPVTRDLDPATLQRLGEVNNVAAAE